MATFEGKPVAFISVLHFPHPKVKNIKKVHRLVVLPDYQGVGIGVKLLEYVAERYNDYKFTITTSNPSLKSYFKKSDKWLLKNQGRMFSDSKTAILKYSSGRFTTGWLYKNNKR